MSLGLTKTKRRIASIQSTQKITKAMGMVATVKLKRFRDVFEASQAYVNGLERIMGELFLHDEPTQTHYAKDNEEVQTTLFLVVTSSLGLCGGYNGNLYKYVESIVDPKTDILVPIGEKGKNHFAHDPRFKNVWNEFCDEEISGLNAKKINELCRKIKAEFNERRVRRVVLIYTRYVNSISFVPDSKTILPVTVMPSPRADEAYCPPLFEPSAREQIHELLPHYLGATLYEKIAESQLCEQASRRNAMDNANDNADELLDKLTIEYNKSRQSAITQEIIEVVSGSVNAR